MKKIRDYQVEWGEEKAKKNERRHGITFDDAALVFADRNRIEFYDTKHSEWEDRFMTVGKVKRTITVIYTTREREIIRIISARKATKQEEDIYYGYR